MRKSTLKRLPIPILVAIIPLAWGLGRFGPKDLIPLPDDVAQMFARLGAPPAITGDGFPVTHVVDGDTCDIYYMPETPEKRRIRFLCINTPERNTPGYQQATQSLANIIDNTHVHIVYDPVMDMTDRGGRTLAYVFAGDVNINVEMVRQGWSLYADNWGQSTHYHDAFEAAEAKARENNRGLWQDGKWTGLPLPSEDQ